MNDFDLSKCKELLAEVRRTLEELPVIPGDAQITESWQMLVLDQSSLLRKLKEEIEFFISQWLQTDESKDNSWVPSIIWAQR